MDPREELQMLRRLAELQAKAQGGTGPTVAHAQADADAAAAVAADREARGREAMLKDYPELADPRLADNPVANWALKNAGIFAGTTRDFARGFGQLGADALRTVGADKAAGAIDTPKEQVDQDRADMENLIAHTAGGRVTHLGTELGLNLLPGLGVAGKAAQAGRAATAAGRALQAVRAVGETAGMGALQGATQTRGTEDDLLRNMALGGAIGGGAGVLTKALGGAAADLVSPEARAYMDQGVYVPAWKALDKDTTLGSGIRGVFEAGKKNAIGRALIGGSEAEGMESWNRMLARRAAPPNLEGEGKILPTGTGSDALRSLGAGYKAGFQKTRDASYFPLDERGLKALDQIAADGSSAPEVAAALAQVRAQLLAGTQREGQESVLREYLTRMNERLPTARRQLGAYDAALPEGLQYAPATQMPQRAPGFWSPSQVTAAPELVGNQNFQDAISTLRGASSKAWREADQPAAAALGRAEDLVAAMRKRGMSPENAALEEQLTPGYAEYLRMKRAATSMGAQKEGGVFSPDQYLNAVKYLDNSANKTAWSHGVAPGQEEGLRAAKVFGNTLPDIGPGTAEGNWLNALRWGSGTATALLAPGALPLWALTTKTGQRALLGGLKGQGAVRANAKQIANAIRASGLAGKKEVEQED